MLSLKKFEPVLFFNNNTLEKQIELLKSKKDNSQEEIARQIKLLEYGVHGEKKVLYELLNSHISMYILHDITIKFNDLEAQIDFLIMTEKSIFVIECKNLYGNITIDKNGTFIREKSKSGMYNPVTQCERHVGLLQKMTYESYGIIRKLFFGNKMDDIFTPLVVLANDKTILNDYYAPKDIKSKVIRADQLINYIKKVDSAKEHLYSEKYIKNYCNALLNYQIESKYVEPQISLEEKSQDCENKKSNLELKTVLKKYRLQKSKEENCKPYIIFSDKTLEEIILKRPTTEEELLSIGGLGQFKVRKYGKEILFLINDTKN